MILQIQEIDCELSRREINMRQIYKGNVYNSNKFMSKELSIINNSSIETTFEFEEINQSTCLIKIEPMKFTLGPKSKRRIDLLIEPVKTGEWAEQIKWKYYDDFKMHQQNYPALHHISYNHDYDSHSSEFIRHETLNLKA